MTKKWYNLFVVSDGQADAAGAPEATEAPRRVRDVVDDAEADAVFSGPVADPDVFEDIYRAAKITVPKHAYSVLKVAEMLQSEHIKALPPDVKKKSVLVALDAAGVKIADIVEDAVQRDRALDTYERVLLKHLEDLRASKEEENKALKAELDARTREVHARIEENNKELKVEHDQLMAWRTKKGIEENRIAEAVGYFVSENPVTRSASPPANKGDSK